MTTHTQSLNNLPHAFFFQQAKNEGAEEVLVYRQTKIARVVMIVLLSLLSLSTLTIGVVCAVLYSAPAFLSLLVVSVSSSIFAYIAYKHFVRIANDNWSALLSTRFNQLSAATANNLFETFGNHLSFWQHKHNPNFYFALPRYADEIPYSLLSPILYRAALADTSYPRFLVNPIHPAFQSIEPTSNPSSQAIYDAITKDELQTEQNSYEDSQYLFAPTESRCSILTIPQHVSKVKASRCPHYLIHTRGPMLAEFKGTQQEIIDQYYLRAFISYKKILRTAIGTQLLHTISVPIFSFVYEQDDDFTCVDHFTAEKLCLSALVHAMDSLAYTQPGKILVCVQLSSTT